LGIFNKGGDKMAKAFGKLSEGGRPLTVLTMGPKEASKLLTALANYEEDENIAAICDAVEGAIEKHEEAGREIPDWDVVAEFKEI
jgi:hypothetical protein